MSDIGDADQEVRRECHFGCPFIKADPQRWLHQKECIVYSNTDLRKTVIRHHVNTAHHKWNEELGPQNPSYIDPSFWIDLKQSLNKRKGHSLSPEMIWRYVYNKIRAAYGKAAREHESPYWSLHWLKDMLNLELPASGNAVDPEDQMQPRVSSQLTSFREELQTVRRFMTKQATDMSNMANQVHLMEYRAGLSEGPKSSETSVQPMLHPANHGAVNNAGTMFPDQSYMPITDQPHSMIDTFFAEDHFHTGIDSSLDPSGHSLLQTEDCTWDNPDFSRAPNQARSTTNTFLALTPARVGARHALISDRATSILTPSSTTSYGPIHRDGHNYG